MPPRRSPSRDGSRTAGQDQLRHDELRRLFSNPHPHSPGAPAFRFPSAFQQEPLRRCSGAPEQSEPEPAAQPIVVTPLLVAASSNDTWKAWAGRKEGGDGFRLSDLFVGTAHAVSNYRRSWKGDHRAAGKECPVCFDEDPPPDRSGKRWMRLYCGCTVCSSCVRNWNVSEIAAGGTTGQKLSCPVCLALMRPHDAAETLQRCSSAAKAVDIKARDEALRNMTDSDTGLQEWHPCPHCETGGGFVTADCISGRHGAVRRSVEEEELEELRHLVAKAEAAAEVTRAELGLSELAADWTRRASNRAGDTAAILCGAPLIAGVLAGSGCSRWIVTGPALAAVVFGVGHALGSPKRQRDYAAQERLDAVRIQAAAREANQQQLAEQRKVEAQRRRQELLEVECPCCGGAFNLPDSSLEHAVSLCRIARRSLVECSRVIFLQTVL